jgi:hypothetical protein
VAGTTQDLKSSGFPEARVNKMANSKYAIKALKVMIVKKIIWNGRLLMLERGLAS